MVAHFSRSMRRLEADGSRRSLLLLAIFLVLIGLWTTWLFRSSVSVYASTGVARLEVSQENHPVDAPVLGRVAAAHLVAGLSVKAGDLLLELDANPERLERSQATAKLAPAGEQLRSLQDELAAQQHAIDVERRSAEAAHAESLAKAQEASAAADLAAEEAKRLSNLQQRGLVSELDALRGQKQAEERQSQANAAEAAAERVTRDLAAKEQDRFGQIARLKNEIAEIEGGRSEAVAASERLDYQIDQRQVRAPIDGTLAEVAPLKVGGMVQAGDRVCTIVPDGALKVVALFRPAVALGRIRNGQSARIRLEGFPWTQYGSAAAIVTSVSGEVRDGQVRVDLALNNPSDSPIPLQHGLPAEVQVEIEHISPFALVLRSVGEQLRLNAASPDLR
jgi:membrane fusion protein (multidrug efflux system)